MAKRYRISGYYENGVWCNTWWALWAEVPNPAWKPSYACVYDKRDIPQTVCVLKSRVHEVEPVYTGGGGGWGIRDCDPLEGYEAPDLASGPGTCDGCGQTTTVDHWRADPGDSAFLSLCPGCNN